MYVLFEVEAQHGIEVEVFKIASEIEIEIVMWR